MSSVMGSSGDDLLSRHLCVIIFAVFNGNIVVRFASLLVFEMGDAHSCISVHSEILSNIV